MHRTARSTAWVFALLAALFTAGCEVFTIDDPNQADRVNPADPTETGSQPAQPASEDTTSIAENASSAVLVGGDGIGPRGAGGGFLWKPISENTGKLVVLLPPQYTGQVSASFVATTGGSVIEQGRFSSVANGNREHYRYSKPGSGYSAGVVVVADLKAGGSVHWPIPSPGSRVEY